MKIWYIKVIVYGTVILFWKSIDCIKSPWDIIATAAAAAGAGNFEVLKWLHELYSSRHLYETESSTFITTPTNERTIISCPLKNSEAASENGASHGLSLKTLRRHQFPTPWTELVCEAAASRGNTDVLKWLRSLSPPCPWNIFVCTVAARNGYLDTLKWLRAQDPPCPWGGFSLFKKLI